MDFERANEINDYLVKIFNEVLLIEEGTLQQSDFKDLSVTEMHTIEAISLTGDLSSTEVARKLNITVGTLSVAIQNLVRKGYVERVRLPEDRRVVRLKLTKKGKLLYRLHRRFHFNMVEAVLDDMSEEEIPILLKGIKNLHRFLFDIKSQMNEEEKNE
ncbi:MarR family winged helix-turn-helix transcriptional regulator [Fundicoccus culcitae]|uniref:MarR family transcriptional regulator n=1 Tax=Fundicoccus culcitae TaxID=2969821 RepID=A0ABY5P6Q0_9LACT|nr:MarR family transcriptional regulator [Fundicoccus culcitae]UUX34261.1 MarR family transcriptional regulator [Fundicoccus culcitae]